nr:unnamed protein product [Digitaria exilis]
MAGAATTNTRPRIKRSRQHKHASASLPLDILLEIAARSDPAILVRCATACRALRRRIAGTDLHGRLRLGQPDRFVPSLLRGRLLVDSHNKDLSLVDNANTTTRLLSAAAASDNDDEVKLWRPLAARDGLVLLQGTNNRRPLVKLCVYCPATGYVQALPPGSALGGRHVLLVGDGDEGGPVEILIGARHLGYL